MAKKKYVAPFCRHGLADGVSVTDVTVTSNYRTGLTTYIYGYFCSLHKMFGCYSYKTPIQGKFKAPDLPMRQ